MSLFPISRRADGAQTPGLPQLHDVVPKGILESLRERRFDKKFHQVPFDGNFAECALDHPWILKARDAIQCLVPSKITSGLAQYKPSFLKGSDRLIDGDLGSAVVSSAPDWKFRYHHTGIGTYMMSIDEEGATISLDCMNMFFRAPQGHTDPIHGYYLERVHSAVLDTRAIPGNEGFEVDCVVFRNPVDASAYRRSSVIQFTFEGLGPEKASFDFLVNLAKMPVFDCLHKCDENGELLEPKICKEGARRQDLVEQFQDQIKGELEEVGATTRLCF